MIQRKQTISVSILLVVLVILFAGARAQKNETAVAAALPLADAPYSAPGPFPVGMQRLATGDPTPLELTLWYPAAADGQQPVAYPYEVKITPPIGTVAFATYAGVAGEDAPPNRADGPYPLVVLSPGFSLGAGAYGWLAEHLAGYGFVVVAPEHREWMDGELSGLWQAVTARPQDILSVLAFADGQTGGSGPLAGLIDTGRVAVVGHSYGGYTALAAAGARIHTGAFTDHCVVAQAEEHPSAWLCDKLLPHLDEMAGRAGMASLPDGLWPAWADPRVDAAVALAGDAFFFGPQGLAEMGLPVLAVGGTADMDTPYAWGTQPTFAHTSSERKVQAGLEGAEHMIFTGPCQNVPFYFRPLSGEFCGDGAWDRGYAHGLVRHLAAAFLLAELKGDAQAAAALNPDAIAFPDVSYTAQGY